MAKGQTELNSCVCVWVAESCPAIDLVLCGGIRKLYGTNDLHGNTTCPAQESCRSVKSRAPKEMFSQTD